MNTESIPILSQIVSSMRLDLLLTERFDLSRTRAQNLIKTGGVRVNGSLVNKASTDVSTDDEIELFDTLKYASIGGLKLENALREFSVNIQDKICLDLGASNGGFTDCLLAFGAAEVSAVDLNVAFPERLLKDPKVKIYDHVNVKSIVDIFPQESFDFISVDLSFISLSGLFASFYPLLRRGGSLIVLFKPQFEVGKRALPKSGVVRDEKMIKKAEESIIVSAEKEGFSFGGDCVVPNIFPDKNRERTILFKKE